MVLLGCAAGQSGDNWRARKGMFQVSVVHIENLWALPEQGMFFMLGVPAGI